MGVGYNPTPIASGVKYTQNNNKKTEQPTIYKNYENNNLQPVNFEIHANTEKMTNQGYWFQSIAEDNYAIKTVVTKQEKTGYTNVGMLNTWTYQVNCLEFTTQNPTTTSQAYYPIETLYLQNPTTYDHLSTFTYSAIQLVPYQEQFNTNIDFTISIYLDSFRTIDADAEFMWYDIYTNPRLFSSAQDYWNRYLDLSNWATSETVYQDIYNELNTPTSGVNKAESNGIVRYNTDGTPQTTGDYRNNRYETLQINVVPNRTNYFFLFMKATLITPTPINSNYLATNPKLETETNKGTTTFFYWFPEPFVNGQYYPVAINYEVVDIPGLMWEILSMPFAFISTAFNLTLFPNTPYQINISNLVLMIFGILVVVFILSKVKSII